jgi:dipeptidyl aminopeptidase/acylaminoacyl peptidase
MTRQIVCFAFACLVAPAALADPFTAEHLVRIDRVGAPAVSPAGDLIVYAVRHTDMDEDKGRYDLWLSTTDGEEPRRLTTHEANDTSPTWSPDGRYILFLSSRGETTQVWRLPVAGGEAQPVTDLPLDVGTFRMSPRLRGPRVHGRPQRRERRRQGHGATLRPAVHASLGPLAR